jgi:hypothetical protein
MSEDQFINTVIMLGGIGLFIWYGLPIIGRILHSLFGDYSDESFMIWFFVIVIGLPFVLGLLKSCKSGGTGYSSNSECVVQYDANGHVYCD